MKTIEEAVGERYNRTALDRVSRAALEREFRAGAEWMRNEMVKCELSEIHASGCVPDVEAIRDNRHPMPEQHIEANARLLAAAPDLLAALESLVETFDPDKQAIYSFARGKIETAKRVIGYIYLSENQ